METGNILIIDDDADYTASTRALLESHGHTVLTASSGTEGLEKIKSEQPDVIVLDIMMETIDEGYSLNQMVKFQKDYEKYRDIPILMVSSIQEDPLSRYPQASGWVDMIIPDQYMTKPLDIPKFLELIGKLLNR